MSTTNHEQLLAQLQTEVNRVLEQAGRIFATASAGHGIGAELAQATKLKHMLPTSNPRFHDALDLLEEELQMAKLAMRRDLAVCREKSGLQRTKSAHDTSAMDVVHDPESDRKASEPGKETVNPTRDVTMEDSHPAEAAQAVDSSVLDTNTSQEAVETTQETTDPSPLPGIPPADSQKTESEKKTHDTGLHIDTDPQPSGNPIGTDQTGEDNDRPPDTGTFSNINDMESLFGGPMSVGGGVGDTTEFPNTTDDFDFDTFGTNLDTSSTENNNDNISALLPGLEDYANTQPVGNGDFNVMFGTDQHMDAGEEMGDKPVISHRDSTFDDLFDLQDFNPDDFADEAGGAGDGNQEFEFSME